jgi:hypothetical protein
MSEVKHDSKLDKVVCTGKGKVMCYKLAYQNAYGQWVLGLVQFLPSSVGVCRPTEQPRQACAAGNMEPH